jgi:alkylated DNA repair dioxygenase AlkB
VLLRRTSRGRGWAGPRALRNTVQLEVMASASASTADLDSDAAAGRETFTVTFGDCAENHVGMQKLGTRSAAGFTVAELETAEGELKKRVGETAAKYVSLTRLEDCLPTQELRDAAEKAGVLVVRKPAVDVLLADLAGGECSVGELWREQNALAYDRKAKMHGRVVNKKARWNLCWAEEAGEADFESGKGTVVAFSSCPALMKLRELLPTVFGSEKALDLFAEGNHYYDESCGIGYHGDAERLVTIALRLGRTMPLRFQWLNKGATVGNPIDFDLNHGDMLVMSQKANGSDWRKQRGQHLHLRHAAGNESYLTFKPKKRPAASQVARAIKAGSEESPKRPRRS